MTSFHVTTSLTFFNSNPCSLNYTHCKLKSVNRYMISGYDVQVHYERHYVKYARFTPEPSAGNECSGGNLPIRKWACDVRQHCPLQWRHNGHDGVSNHQPHDCLLSRLFRRGSKHQSSASLAFFAGNSPVTNEFPAQRASKAENCSIWWRHHVFIGPPQ